MQMEGEKNLDNVQQGVLVYFPPYESPFTLFRESTYFLSVKKDARSKKPNIKQSKFDHDVLTH